MNSDCRKLTSEQKALMSSFAELEKNVDGTVYTSPNTQSSKLKFSFLSHWIASDF